jgi:hypothetical protein
MDEGQRKLKPEMVDNGNFRKNRNSKGRVTEKSHNDFSGNDHKIIKSIIKDANLNQIKYTADKNQK